MSIPALLRHSRAPDRDHWYTWVLRHGALVITVLGAILASTRTQAHTASTAFLQLSESHQRINAQLELPMRDLDDLLGLDANDDGQLTWGELQARRTDLTRYVAPRLGFAAGGQPLALQWTPHRASQRNGEGYVSLEFTMPAPKDSAPLEIRYELFFERDPLHRCLVRWSGTAGPAGGAAATAMLAPDRTRAEFAHIPGSPASLATFIREGVHHIWTGYDHLLFLVALLLPAVLRRTDTGWVPAPTFRGATADVLKVVTAFTVAHSLTLALAAFEIIRLPSRLVESTIAASIIVAALGNVWPMRVPSTVSAERHVPPARNRWLVPWKVAFVFGLIHGFGFAGVLGELGLQRSQLATPLFGFNAGVELGQLACVAVFLPLAFLLRSTRFYRRGALPLGSIAIMVLAGGWWVERTFGLGFMPI